jgi:hypothetical protein
MRSLHGLLSPSSCRNQLTNGFELVKIRSTISNLLSLKKFIDFGAVEVGTNRVHLVRYASAIR